MIRKIIKNKWRSPTNIFPYNDLGLPFYYRCKMWNRSSMRWNHMTHVMLCFFFNFFYSYAVVFKKKLWSIIKYSLLCELNITIKWLCNPHRRNKYNSASAFISFFVQFGSSLWFCSRILVSAGSCSLSRFSEGFWSWAYSIF